MQTATLSRLDGSARSDELSVRSVWMGRALFALPVLFLTFDTVIKLLRLPFAVEATRQLGFPADAPSTTIPHARNARSPATRT